MAPKEEREEEKEETFDIKASDFGGLGVAVVMDAVLSSSETDEAEAPEVFEPSVISEGLGLPKADNDVS